MKIVFYAFILLFLGIIYFLLYKSLSKRINDTFWKYVIPLIIIAVSLIINEILIFVLYFLVINFLTNLFLKNKMKYPEIISLSVTTLLIVFGMININTYTKTEYNIKTKLNNNYKIAFISDLHYNGKSIKKITEKIKKENPDILILGGDITDEATTKAQMLEVYYELGKINPKYGTYFIYGNHDRQNYLNKKEYDEYELYSTIINNNIFILSDTMNLVNDEILLIGRKDFSTPRKTLETLTGYMENASYIIDIDHQPKDYEEASKRNINLILSGHTHAGQVFPMGIFIDLLKTSDQNYGIKKIKKTYAIVSSGIRGWRLNLKTQGKSEYVIINLTK